MQFKGKNHKTSSYIINNLLSSEIPRPTVDIFKTHLDEEIGEHGKLYLEKVNHLIFFVQERQHILRVKNKNQIQLQEGL